MSWLTVLNREVVACTLCTRLVAYRQAVAREKRRAYRDWDYWAKPVPGFGDPDARVLILGLAPGAHGSNRTGRPFTGDSSGNFMYPVLYETGFANQPTAINRNDGLKLKNLYITAAVRCVALGKIGFDAYLNHLKRRGLLPTRKPYLFRHGAHYQMPDGKVLLASYHPSNQNTATGKLTRKMFVNVFQQAAKLAAR